MEVDLLGGVGRVDVGGLSDLDGFKHQNDWPSGIQNGVLRLSYNKPPFWEQIP